MTKEEAIAKLKNFADHCYPNEEFLMAIKALEQEQKTGHWIYSKAVNTGEIIFSECSVCGNGESGCAKRMKYCPNCGAKMVEPQESEKINCKSTKCENCINHNYCDYEPQERSEKE